MTNLCLGVSTFCLIVKLDCGIISIKLIGVADIKLIR